MPFWKDYGSQLTHRWRTHLKGVYGDYVTLARSQLDRNLL
jgi:hypothetical protein